MLTLIMTTWLGATAPAGPVTYAGEQLAALSETALVPESSGVAASPRNPGVYWTHNDSGSERPRVYAFRLSAEDRARKIAKHLGYVELPGASNKDWEDIAAGPDGRFYILDGGDNPPCKRTEKRIIRFAEPRIDAGGPPVALTAKSESIRFEYPDPEDPSRPAGRDEDRFDAECLLVHPKSGDLFIVTKRSSRNTPAVRVYKRPVSKVSWDSERVHVLEFVADLSSLAMNMVTGGDVDREGRRVVLRNYWSAFEYTLLAGRPFDDIFRQKPRTIPLAAEVGSLLQGEGICYTTNGRDLVITTESPRGPADERFRVFVVPGPAVGTRP